jgi:tRNA-uridine aminocarboxypropyltransferase
VTDTDTEIEIKRPGNSVKRLRDEKHLQLRKPFASRGSKLKRCEDCLLVEHHCVCALRPEVNSSSAFCFIYYQGEVLKPSNTGRLIADVVKDNHAFQWQRTMLEPALESLLKNPHYQPIIIFPHEYAKPEDCIHAPNELDSICSGRQPLFVILDGTWREARKMFRSDYLRGLPVLGIQPTQASAYQLRETPQDYQLCTAEVGVEVLKIHGDYQAANALQRYFEAFRLRYLAGKANIRVENKA